MCSDHLHVSFDDDKEHVDLNHSYYNAKRNLHVKDNMLGLTLHVLYTASLGDVLGTEC